MTDDKSPSDPDNPLTPMEKTIDPADLDAMRAVAADVSERRVPRRPTAPEPALDDTTLPDGDFPTEPDSDGGPADNDNPFTPMEQTLAPADLDAVRAVAAEASERRVPRRPTAPEPPLDDTTIPDADFLTEPDSDSAPVDNDNPQTPLEPTLDPSDLTEIREAAASISDRTPLPRPKPPTQPTIALPPSIEKSAPPASDSSPAAACGRSPEQPGSLNPPPPAPAPFAATPTPAPVEAHDDNRRMWQLVVPTAFLLAIVMLLAGILPTIYVHWKKTEALAEADAIYLKRRAELKAESEAASAELELIDRNLKAEGRSFRLVVNKVRPSVVNIANLKELSKKDEAASKKGSYHDPANSRRYDEASFGSGVLFKPGYLITNYHVVKGADRLRIIFNGGRAVGVDASAVVSDPVTDLAVVKLPTDVSDELKEDMKQTVDFADSDKDVQVGDFALATGSPKNLRQTTTLGIVSAKGRLIDRLDMVELMQTDAAVNFGSSGGALFNARGQVVGIVVALVNEKGVDLSIGFAVPSNTARKIADALIEHGAVSRGYLGISMEEFAGPEAKLLGIGGGAVIVTKVLPGDIGDKAGIQAKDIIVKFNGESLQSFQAVRHLRHLVADAEPGREATLEIFRDNRRRELKVTMGKRPLTLPVIP